MRCKKNWRDTVAILAAIFCCAAASRAIAQDTPGEAQLNRETIEYRKLGERRLVLVVHYPPNWKAVDTRPAILFFEGGALNPKDKQGDFFPSSAELAAKGVVPASRGPGEAFAPQADYFARRGLVTIRVEYRQRRTDGVMPDGTVADGAAAVRWVREHAGELGFAPDRVVVAGSSGGGHLAASLFALEQLFASDNAGNQVSATSARPNVMLLYSPMLDFIDEGAMGARFLEAVGGDRELAERLSPRRHWRPGMPPTLIFEGDREPVYKTVTAFAAEWRQRGEPIEIFIGEGGGHGFANKSPWVEKTTARADEFLQSLGYLAAEPKIELPGRGK